jgi:RimJ/RimL family protein N-acetyltransferase
MSIAIVNRYQPPAIEPAQDLWGPEQEYDINFIWPLHSETLENDVLKLTPFIPRIHAQAFWDAFHPHAEALTAHIPWVLPNISALLNILEYIRLQPEWVLLAVIDKTRPAQDGSDPSGALSGMIGLLRSEPAQRKTEIGPVITLPAFQRTHVTSNAIGLLLHYCLNLPSASPPGLGLRRVMWGAPAGNPASLKAALRMGFQEEGTLRWQRVYPEGKEGVVPRENDPAKGPGVHMISLGLCWDDWENGGRQQTVEAMKPRGRGDRT